jgi:Transposase IS200 like
MPSTHSSLHIHIVFSTKERFPFIHPEWKRDLHAFLGGCLKRLDAFPQEIGGVADHVHLLIGIKPVNPLVYASEGFRSALVPQSPHLPQAVILVALVVFDTGLLLFGLRQFRRKALT